MGPVTWGYVLLSLLSGIAWGGIAFLLGRRVTGPEFWGGLYASPLIGVVVGLAFRRIYRLPRAGRIVMSLVLLYCASALFGLGMGLYALARGAAYNTPAEIVVQDVYATLWGITFTGYFLMLWPLAYLNIHLLGREGQN